MSVKVKFARLRENAKIPVRRSCDAGYDIYACFDEQEMRLEPNETKLVPTGIASAFDEGWCFVLKERGSTGIRGFGQRAGVMDSGFRGEWHVALTNHNDVPLIISKDGAEREDAVVYPYEKAICQAAFACAECGNIRDKPAGISFHSVRTRRWYAGQLGKVRLKTVL